MRRTSDCRARFPGLIRIRRIAVFCVIALLQQKESSAQFTLPNQMPGFQSFIEIQLQKRLQMLCFVILKNPELPGIRCCFPRYEMNPDIIKECIISGAFYRIGDPLVPEFRRTGPFCKANVVLPALRGMLNWCGPMMVIPHRRVHIEQREFLAFLKREKRSARCATKRFHFPDPSRAFRF